MTPLPIADATPPQAPSPAPQVPGAAAQDHDAAPRRSFADTFRNLRDPGRPSAGEHEQEHVHDGKDVPHGADPEARSAHGKPAQSVERDDKDADKRDDQNARPDAAAAAAIAALLQQAREPVTAAKPAASDAQQADTRDPAGKGHRAAASGLQVLEALRQALAAGDAQAGTTIGADVAVANDGDSDTGTTAGKVDHASTATGSSASARFTAQLASMVQANSLVSTPHSPASALALTAPAATPGDATAAGDRAARADAATAPGLGLLPASLATVAAPPITRSVTLPMTDPHWAQAMAQAVVDAVGTDGGRVRLQLNPAHLGPVDIALDIDKDQAKLQIFAAQAPTRAALQQAIPQLGALLASGGLQLAHADVFTGQSGRHGGGSDASPTPADAGSSSSTRIDAPTRLLSLHRGLIDDYA